MFMEATMSSSFSPFPNRTPTWVLRLCIDAQVAITSPMPARPENVADCAPNATPRRDISARPRVTNVAFEFSPKPKPCEMPDAIATTFLTTPPISHPTTSGFVYKRNVGRLKISIKSRATDSSVHAITLAAGCPARISFAKFGPLSTATGLFGMICSITSLIRLNVPCSSPFDKLMTGTPARTYLLTSFATSRKPSDGTAIATTSTCARAVCKSLLACKASGRTVDPKYAELVCSELISSASSPRRDHSTVGALCEASAAIVVPHEPAPTTHTRCVTL